MNAESVAQAAIASALAAASDARRVRSWLPQNYVLSAAPPAPAAGPPGGAASSESPSSESPDEAAPSSAARHAGGHSNSHVHCHNMFGSFCAL